MASFEGLNNTGTIQIIRQTLPSYGKVEIPVFRGCLCHVNRRLLVFLLTSFCLRLLTTNSINKLQ